MILNKQLALVIGIAGECLLALADLIDPLPGDEESRLRDAVLGWRTRI